MEIIKEEKPAEHNTRSEDMGTRSAKSLISTCLNSPHIVLEMPALSPTMVRGADQDMS